MNQYPSISSKREGIAAPLKNSVFRRLWVANFLSNLGTIMHAVAAAWVMTSLTNSPWLIGLVQTAFNLPVLLLGIPCGVLADLFDRRRLLMVAQCWMMAVAVLMALFVGLGKMTPWSLLFFLFLLGVGAALHFPAWLALLQDLVMPQHVDVAVSLNSIGFNLARTLGPALGGFCVNVLGASLVFFGNALSYLAVLLGLMRTPAAVSKAKEKMTIQVFFHSLAEAWRFAQASPILPGIFLRFAFFMVAASGFWGLLPFIARDRFHLSATGYGEFLSAFGVGSVVGALFLPRLRSYFSVDTLLGFGSLFFAGCLLMLAMSQHAAFVAVTMMFCGVAWIMVVVNYNVSIQLAAPVLIKGRMISFYIVIFQGGMGMGSALAGWIAARYGYQISLTIDAFIVAASLLLIPFFPVHHEVD